MVNLTKPRATHGARFAIFSKPQLPLASGSAEKISSLASLPGGTSKKLSNRRLLNFLSNPKDWYAITPVGRACNPHPGAVWHHALACIPPNLRIDYIQDFVLITYSLRLIWEESIVGKNLLLDYSEELAIKCEKLCKATNANANSVFQLRKSSSSVFANITEAQYPQSLADMLSKFKIARKECAETESWLKLFYNTGAIDEETFKSYRNLCGRIQRMLTASCITIENKIKSK